MSDSNDKPPVIVIGAGVVGICTASFLQRQGRRVTVIEAGEVGMGASYGNAGCLNGSSVVPVSMPGVLAKVPGWLLDPDGPLVLRWSYLPQIAPWLFRFVRAGREKKVKKQARALRPLLQPSIETYGTLEEVRRAHRRFPDHKSHRRVLPEPFRACGRRPRAGRGPSRRSGRGGGLRRAAARGARGRAPRRPSRTGSASPRRRSAR